jgi:CDP-diacylglycerol--glycerol-3-phosphate 3-phosphatidyltransferase
MPFLLKRDPAYRQKRSDAIYGRNAFFLFHFVHKAFLNERVAIRSKREDSMNLPNKLTILRVILIPVFIIFLTKEYYYISGILFVAASITDALDGYLARKYNLITDFGKIIDPLADKLLITSALICLVQLGSIAGWLAIVILAREFVITSLRSVAAREGIIIVAERSGKIKTVLQMLALSVIMLRNWPFSIFTDLPIGDYLLWLAVGMTLYSGIEYIIKNKTLLLPKNSSMKNSPIFSTIAKGKLNIGRLLIYNYCIKKR